MTNKTIQKDSNDPIYHNNLGLAYKAECSLDKAISCYEKAINIKSDYFEAYKNMGIAYHEKGKLKEAILCYQKAIKIKPDDTDVYYNMAIALNNQDKLDEAIFYYQKVVEISPEDVDAYYNMSIALKKQGKFEDSIRCCRRGLLVKPDDAKLYNNIGVALMDLKRLDEAIECFKKALQIDQNYLKAFNNLGNALRGQGRLDVAIEIYKKALCLDPYSDTLYNNLGSVYNEQSNPNEAIYFFNKALKLKPNNPITYNNIGLSFRLAGKLDEAITSFKKALFLSPTFARAYYNIGEALRLKGRIGDAIENFKKALQLCPDLPFVHSDILISLCYQSKIDPVYLFQQHLDWAASHASSIKKNITTYHNHETSKGQLRIGYVSPDFRKHSVAFFLEPILEYHNKNEFEIFCYSDVRDIDFITERIKSHATCWRDIRRMSDDMVAELIRQDKIDILVDLAGHTTNNRMPLFAMKPAPIQVTYIGYPNTTGLSTIDYRITDSLTDPPGETEHLHTEKLVRLPQSFLCYRANKKTPPISSLPAGQSEIVTFGSFNNRPKITEQVVAVWSKILRIKNNTRLILKSIFLSDQTQKELQKMFIQNGIDIERIKFNIPIPSYYDHLNCYNSIDIGLDTFPYNGTTTTCEAMWMGVPVIVLEGQTHISRVGVSLLSSVGISDLIAKTEDDYIEKAVQLASDTDRLRSLRENLRDMMLHSPLMDAQRFTLELEDAYRNMWNKYTV